MADRITEVLDELERLAKEATPGPWECPEVRGYASNFVYKSGGMRRQICRTMAQASNDGRFIAALNPARALELLAVVRAAYEAKNCQTHEFIERLHRVLYALEKIGGTSV